MQDKTINNALLALYRTGDAREHVTAIMALRSIDPPQRMQDRPLSRGKCSRIVLGCLPCTTPQAADAIQAQMEGVARRSAWQRAYMALLRLEERGVVVQDFGPDGCLWRLAQ